MSASFAQIESRNNEIEGAMATRGGPSRALFDAVAAFLLPRYRRLKVDDIHMMLFSHKFIVIRAVERTSVHNPNTDTDVHLCSDADEARELTRQYMPGQFVVYSLYDFLPDLSPRPFA